MYQTFFYLVKAQVSVRNRLAYNFINECFSSTLKYFELLKSFSKTMKALNERKPFLYYKRNTNCSPWDKRKKNKTLRLKGFSIF